MLLIAQTKLFFQCYAADFFPGDMVFDGEVTDLGESLRPAQFALEKDFTDIAVPVPDDAECRETAADEFVEHDDTR